MNRPSLIGKMEKYQFKEINLVGRIDIWCIQHVLATVLDIES